ncbi:MAG: MBL fold metallo-hydrolase [Candidatus Omnitrophica bacterium]|nr:MBL fold metallo-hydrolase [Candidatus Omnitrophota bacterium]
MQPEMIPCVEIDTAVIRTIAVGELQTNCYILAPRGESTAVIVDPGAESERLKKIVDHLNLDIRAVFLTHGHFDHLGAVESFAVPVFIHAADRDCLSDSTKNYSEAFGVSLRVDGQVHAVQDGDILTPAGLSLRVIHTPGHTRGGICLLGSSFLLSGDTLFYRGIGRTDLAGGSSAQIVAAIREKLFCLDDAVRVFPGHGPPTTIGEEKRENPYLE